MKKLLVLICLFSALISQAQERILLKNFTLIDGTGTPIKVGMNLVVAGDTIQSLFSGDEQSVEGEVQTIDLSGKFLLPGLFDAHVHMATAPSSRDNIDITKERLALMLKNGVTGVRDMAGDARLLAFLSRQAKLDEIPSPDIYYSSLMAGRRFFQRDRRSAASARGEVAGQTPWTKALDSGTDITLAIAEAKGAGATGIKLYANLSTEQVRRVVEEANKQQMKVWGHAAILPGVPSDMVNAGVTCLSHSLMLALEELVRDVTPGRRPVIDTALHENAPKLEALVKTMAEKGVYLDPTITIYRGRGPGPLYENSVLATKIAYEAGVPLVVGTDLGVNTQSFTRLPLIDEMAALVNDAKIPPLEVIKAATKNTADYLGLGQQTGTIEVGKRANILIVNENPLADMINLSKVFQVLKNGRLVIEN